MEATERMTEREWWLARAWTDQRTPALAIVARGDQITSSALGQYTVCSQEAPGRFHHVKKEGPKWSCDCPFYAATGLVCVHVFAVRIRDGLQESGAKAEPSKTTCEACRSPDVVCQGIRRNKSGDVQRYFCKSCGRRFVGRDGFQRRRADPEKIALALDLYFRGLSVRKVSEHFRQVYGLIISHVAVYRWVVHYGTLAARWMDAQGARTGDRWHIDETVVNVNGENTYLWNVLDSESRFLLATHISHNRSLANTRAPLRKAKHATADRPFEVMSDGMNAYPVAIGKELGRKATATDLGLAAPTGWSPIKKNGRLNPHHRVPSIRAPESNNRIERFHGTEKERTKVMRAFDSESGSSALMEGFRANYNLQRAHQTLGMTPGEAAGIPTGAGFRWRKVIEEATKAMSRTVTPTDSGTDVPPT